MSQQESGLVSKFVRFLRRYYKEDVGQLAARYPHDQSHLEVSWRDLYQFDADMADDLLDQPGQVLDYLEEALRVYDLPVDVDLASASARIADLPDDREFSVGGFRPSRRRAQLMAVTGQITKAAKARPQLEDAAFECQRCGALTFIPQSGGQLQEPHECQGCDRQGPFKIDDDQSVYRDFQLARLQQPPEESKGGDGRFVDVHLHGDLVGEAQPGDRVTAVSELKFTAGKKGSRVRDTYLHGNNVRVQDTDFEEIDVDEYREEIEAIAASDDPLGMVADSIAPKHHGDAKIKEALALQLFGGVRVVYPDGTADRGNVHVLLLGDPGMGKSVMLKAIADIAPRSVKSSGKGASKAGMTAAAVRDDFGDTEWTLEAGALVLANKGVACVDEVDKVPEEVLSSLHGALEEERVDVNKAGINASLPAQTALLAAGNPKYGRFDQYEAIAEQIELDPALMSRFDLWLMVADDIDEGEERVVTEHRVRSRRDAKRRERGEEGEYADIEPAIDRDVLRAYIAHAKQEYDPMIRDDDVADRLTQFFSKLRLANQAGADAPVPVTRRKLGAIFRLADASARARLSDTVEREDAERAIGLVTHSMRQVGMDPETGQFDADVVETGSSKTQRDRIKSVLSLVEELQTVDEPASLADLEDLAGEHGLAPGKLHHTLKKLRQKGQVYQPADGQYRTVN